MGARKCGTPAKNDPDLASLGLEQAEALGAHLARILAPRGASSAPSGVLIVSSPMRRCLRTIEPTRKRLGLPREACLCHGAAYEFRCTSSDFKGTTPSEIARVFPNFMPVGFGPDEYWDSSTAGGRETEAETRLRVHRFVAWLCNDALAALESQSSGAEDRTL